MKAAHLDDVFQAMDHNGLLRQSHLLTGARDANAKQTGETLLKG